jgi:uncharacterized lipoprotein YddW (UPF0748 family)
MVNTRLNICLAVSLAGFAFSPGAVSGAAVALVRGELTARQNPTESRAVGTYHQTVKDCLTQERVAFDEMSDSDVAAGKLAGHRVAILTYNWTLSEAEVVELEKFLARDGKIIVFYAVHPRLAAKLGIRLVKHEQSDPAGLFSAMRFKSGLVAGTPAVVPQASWNINVVELVQPQTRLLAEWEDNAGRPTGRPAWILSAHGAWMSHILLPGEMAAKRRLLLAVIGHFLPVVWERTARASIRAIGRVGGHRNLDELAGTIASTTLPPPTRQEAQRNLERARKARQRAMGLLLDNQFTPALAAADAAKHYAASAFYRIQPSRSGEFRAAWIHSAYGVNDWGWDRTARALEENGFNAIFPNLLWAGLAYYPSQVLPVADRVATQGDQVAECLRACRQHHLEMHVWKVDHNLATAPSNFLARLRAEGRTQKSRSGEDIDWLCPSHPENFAFERDSLLELVRNYDLDGIHFDYIRYPSAGACYCGGCRARFEQASGVTPEPWPGAALSGPLAPKYADWRRDQITRLVKTVREEAHKLKPNLKVSAAVFGDWASCRQDVGQDWKLWVDSGWLDFVCPMNYETNNHDFVVLVRQQAGWVNRKIPLYAGIGAYKMAAPDQLVRQILLARESGADGFVLFQHDARLASEFLPALRLGVTSAAPK